MSVFNIIGKTVKVFHHGFYKRGQAVDIDYETRKVLVDIYGSRVWIPEEYVKIMKGWF